MNHFPYHFTSHSLIMHLSNQAVLWFFLDVWAFDSDAVKALKDMKPMDMEKLVAKYSILLDPDSELLPQNRPNTLVGATSICQFLMNTQFSLIWHIHLQHEAIYIFYQHQLSIFSQDFSKINWACGSWKQQSRKKLRYY